MKTLKRIICISTLAVATACFGWYMLNRHQDGREPQEVTANRLIVYIEKDTLTDALKAHETDGWFEFSTFFLASSVTIQSADNKKEEFCRIINSDSIAAQTAQLISAIEWKETDDAASLTLKGGNGGVTIPVWLLMVLKDKGVLNP